MLKLIDNRFFRFVVSFSFGIIALFILIGVFDGFDQSIDGVLYTLTYGYFDQGGLILFALTLLIYSALSYKVEDKAVLQNIGWFFGIIILFLFGIHFFIGSEV